MSKSNQTPAPAATPVAAAVAEAYKLADAASKMVTAQAQALSTADRNFENATAKVAEEVARVLGDPPSYDHWTAVQSAFIADYVKARGCNEETGRKRWVALVSVMETNHGQTKPTKPTKAAEVKAAQREGAAAEAAALIEKAKATTPAAILALSQTAGVKAPVVAALAKQAGEVAKEASKAATEAAREEAKAIREELRKLTQAMSLEDLRKVRAYCGKLVAKDEPAAPAAPATTEPTETPAAQ